MAVRNTISSREFNHSASEVLRQAREGDVVPISYGRGGDVAAYLIPVATMRSQEELLHLREQLLAGRRAARDIVMSSTVTVDSTGTLRELREGERF